MAEIKDSQLNRPEAIQPISGIENALPVSSPEVPQSSDQNSNKVDTPLDQAIRKAEQEGKIGYDSPIVKKRVNEIKNISPYEGHSWAEVIENKTQGLEENIPL